jgi:hypothetical protein
MATGRIGTTPVLTTRWSKAPAAGTTSLSGLDDNSVSLVYSVGYEAVYQNGVLLSRGNDYTATNGTTITLTTATVAGDIIEVFANQTIPLTDTYSQTVSDGRFIKNTLTTTTGDIIYASAANTPARLGIGSTSQVLTVSGGVPTWASAPASSGPAFRAFRGTSSQSFSAFTETKIQFQSESFDTDSCYDNATNYRFTPNKAAIIWKNGAQASVVGQGGPTATNSPVTASGTDLIYFNGSTDYVEGYVYSESATSRIVDWGAQNSYFAGVWIRS